MEVGHEAANKVGKRNAHDDGNKTADDDDYDEDYDPAEDGGEDDPAEDGGDDDPAEDGGDDEQPSEMKVNNAAITGVHRAAIPGVDDGRTTGVDDGRTTGVDTEERTDTANGRAGVPEEGRAGAPEEAAVADDSSTTGVGAEVADDGRPNQAALDREMQDDRYDMRQRREPDYSHLFANTHEDEMSVKKGLKVFGKDGIEAVMKEMLVVSRAPTVVSCLMGTDDMDTHGHFNVDLWAPTVVSCLTGTYGCQRRKGDCDRVCRAGGLQAYQDRTLPHRRDVGSILTEPLQGLQFAKLRGLIMNVAPSSRYHSTHSGHRSVLKINSPSSPTENDVLIFNTLL
jgi:hypothetical protein